MSALSMLWNQETVHGILKDWVLLEYAESLHDAQNHMYEDGDMIPLDVDIGTIIFKLRQEVEKAIK